MKKKDTPLSNLFVSIPHSGEKIPIEAGWLKRLPEVVVMRDVDRFVDRIYVESLKSLTVPVIVTPWHRYAADLNRFPTDIDPSTVIGSTETFGKFQRGFHWSVTTLGETLLTEPITMELHDQIVKKYFEPFHEEIQKTVASARTQYKNVYHIDAHSMPSLGTKEHRDPGQFRTDFVISDQNGTSCSERFKDLVIKAYEEQGFSVTYNWPYLGGRITEHYGKPANGHHTIQIELNRKLYMNEETKQYLPQKAEQIIPKIKNALSKIQNTLSHSDFN